MRHSLCAVSDVISAFGVLKHCCSRAVPALRRAAVSNMLLMAEMDGIIFYAAQSKC